MSNDPKFYYASLNLTPDASAEAIKLSYRELAKLWHPDHNTNSDALEKFQQLSVAYDNLSDERKRLIYDLLSMVYTPSDYPDLDTLEPFKDLRGQELVNIRTLNLQDVRGQLWTYRVGNRRFYGTAGQAVNQEFKTSTLNWLLGWWHPVAFLKNIAALQSNFCQINPIYENLRLLVHNAVAYLRADKPEFAAQSAVLALGYANSEQKLPLQKLIASLGIRVSRPRKWNFGMLRLVQLLLPLLVVILVFLPPLVRSLGGSDLLSFFSSKETIDYYQQVRFKGRGQTVDDVVVGKVLNIPVDRTDVARLYHLKSAQSVMYGPSESFDVLKKLPENTTVRLTGVSPDNIWARIMIDNGEMGYVLFENMVKGIGKPVPDFSKVYER